jgi:hypothetical protein
VLRPGELSSSRPIGTDAARFHLDQLTVVLSRTLLTETLVTAGFHIRVAKQHNVYAGVGRSGAWRFIPQLCFTGDALFTLAERNGELTPSHRCESMIAHDEDDALFGIVVTSFLVVFLSWYRHVRSMTSATFCHS